MKKTSKKRGQKLSQRLSNFSREASQASQEHIKENFLNRLPHARNVRLLILEWSLLMIVLILLAITQVFWYADSYSVDTFGRGGAYTEATLGKVSSFNPIFATTNSEKVLSKLMFATLTETDYSGHAGVGLADTVRADDTGKVWAVRLRENLKWSDGEPITNQDVIFTVKIIQNSEVKSTFDTNLVKVDVEEDEDGNLIFTLPSPYANFSSALNIPILPKHILGDVSPEALLEHEFSTTKPVTSGAFSYNASQPIDAETGEKIVYLAANPYYYGSKPLIDSFAIHAFATTDNIIDAVNSGSVTATAELLSIDADKVVSKNIYQKETAINSGVFAFINTSNTLRDKSLRQAIQKGIDLDELRSVLKDEPALDYPILSTQMKLNFPALPTHDTASAVEIIKDAELDPEMPIAIATISTGYFPALAENLSEQLKELGFKTEVAVYEPDQDFLMNIIRRRNYDILVYEIELGADPDLFAYYHSSQATSAGINLSNYRNLLADDVILAARNTMDATIRTSKYESFLKYWVEDVPAIGIYQTNLTYYFNKNTRNFSEDNHLVTAADRFYDVPYWSAVKERRNRTP